MVNRTISNCGFLKTTKRVKSFRCLLYFKKIIFFIDTEKTKVYYKKKRPTVGLKEGCKMELKDRIIYSAYELFSIQGYEKTTIEAIIKKAECAKGGFYHHFKSKEEILELIVFNYIQDISKQYEKIITNNKLLFIDKFNGIFNVICQDKLKELKEWPRVKNIFHFAGNEKILRKLEQEFKIITVRTYSEVIREGNNQGIISITRPEVIAEFCTRQLLWIFEVAGKLVNSDDVKDHDRFEALLDFIEGLVSHSLGTKNTDIEFKAVALSYLKSIKTYFLSYKEGL